jgi:hypothetical protein
VAGQDQARPIAARQSVEQNPEDRRCETRIEANEHEERPAKVQPLGVFIDDQCEQQAQGLPGSTRGDRAQRLKKRAIIGSHPESQGEPGGRCEEDKTCLDCQGKEEGALKRQRGTGKIGEFEGRPDQ